MNQKYFIISLTLHALFFLMHFEKTYGCHPSGQGCTVPQCGGGIVKVEWKPNFDVQLTIEGPYGYKPQAVGHFSFDDGKGHKASYFSDPFFINDQHCDHSGPNQANQTVVQVSYKPKQAPEKGSLATVRISVYWKCDRRVGATAIHCRSQDATYYSLVT